MTTALKQRGMTLIEVIVAISIGMILMSLVAAGFNTYQTYQTNSITSEWLKTWQAGAQQWINDNSAALSASGGGTATQTTLNSAGYFGPGFAATNSYGQTGTLHVVVGPGGRLDGLICVSGGQAPTGLQQRQIAGMVGIAGGWVPSSAPTQAVGKGWGPVNLGTYGIASGGCDLVVALFVANLASTDDALHRHTTPRQPQLNQMSTAIDMNNNNLDNVATINAKLLNLPAGNSINIGGSYLYGDASNLATRSPSGGFYIQTTTGASGNIVQVHNISGDSGSTFSAQYVSAATGLWANNYVNTNGTMQAGGNIYSGGDITANGAVFANNWFRSNGNTGWYNQTYGGGWYMSDPTWLRSVNDKSVYTGGNITAGSDISAGGAMTANNWFRSNGNTGWLNQSYGGGWYMSDPSWIRAYGDKGVYTGGQVQAGSLQSNGAITAAGDISAGGAMYANNWFRSNGNSGWYNQTYGGGWYMSDPSWIRAYGDKNVYTGGQVQAGQIQSNGRMFAKEYIEVDSNVAPGAGCSPNGLISKASDGSGMLQCKAGIWVGMGGVSRMVNVYGASTCSNGSSNQKNVTMCPAGYKAVNAGHQLLYYNNGGNWWMANNGPDSQYVNDDGNGATMIMGGSGGYSCARQVVTCAQ